MKRHGRTSLLVICVSMVALVIIGSRVTTNVSSPALLASGGVLVGGSPHYGTLYHVEPGEGLWLFWNCTTRDINVNVTVDNVMRVSNQTGYLFVMFEVGGNHTFDLTLNSSSMASSAIVLWQKIGFYNIGSNDNTDGVLLVIPWVSFMGLALCSLKLRPWAIILILTGNVACAVIQFIEPNLASTGQSFTINTTPFQVPEPEYFENNVPEFTAFYAFKAGIHFTISDPYAMSTRVVITRGSQVIANLSLEVASSYAEYAFTAKSLSIPSWGLYNITIVDPTGRFNMDVDPWGFWSSLAPDYGPEGQYRYMLMTFSCITIALSIIFLIINIRRNIKSKKG